MQPIILVSCEAPFRSNLTKKNHTLVSGGHTGPVRVMTHWTRVFFCKLLLNGASHDTKIGCISLVWAGAKKYKFYFLLSADPFIRVFLTGCHSRN